MTPLNAVLSPESVHSTLSVGWASTPAEILLAQKLRALAFGFCPPGTPEEDIVPECDQFDAFARHLIVTDTRTGQCLGTYRLLDPEGAKKAGGTYTETEFDLAPLAPYRARMVELGRSCVHPDYRQGGVITLLWSALARTLLTERVEFLIGCASVDLTDPALDPDRIWTYLRNRAWEGAIDPVTPYRPFPCVRRDSENGAIPALPPLLKGYLRLGARCLGNPSHDPVFKTADFPVWLPIFSMKGRYVRHFFRHVPENDRSL